MNKFNQTNQVLLDAISVELSKTGRTDILAKIQNGSKRAVQTAEMFRKNVNAAAGDLNGTINLVEVSDNLKKGAITLHQGKLTPGVVMAINKFSFEYGSHATITDSAQVALSNFAYSDVATKAQRIPTKLLNAAFTLTHGGVVVIKGIVGDYVKQHDIDPSPGIGAESHNAYRNVNPIYIADDLGQFQLTIDLPSVGSMGSSVHHIGFKLDGVSIIDR